MSTGLFLPAGGSWWLRDRSKMVDSPCVMIKTGL
jgi:hypothetical protein